MDVSKVSHQSTSSCSVQFSVVMGIQIIFKIQRSFLQIKGFLIKSKNIQKVHVCFASKIITQLMFTTKFHLGSLHKFYRALLTSLLCVFLMMERPFRIGFCFSCAVFLFMLELDQNYGSPLPSDFHSWSLSVWDCWLLFGGHKGCLGYL